MREQCFQLKTLQLLIDTCSFPHANLWPVSIFLNPASSNLTLTRVSKLKDFANKIAPAFMATLLKFLFAQQLPQRLHWIKTEFGPIRSFNASSQRSFTQSDRVLKKAYPFLELHKGTKALISPEDLYQFFIDVASPLAQMLFPLAESCLRVIAKTFSCANSQVTMLYDCLSNDAQGSAYGKGFAIIIIRFVVVSSPQECIKWLKKDRMDKRMERVQKQRRPMRKQLG